MKTLPMEGRVEAECQAPPDAVWKVVGDPTRTGEWSHETRSVVWVDGSVRPSVGARFRGANRNGRFNWSRTCELTTVESPRSISWSTIRTRRFPDSTDWTIELEPLADGGTRIVQRYRVTSINPVMNRLYWLMVPAHRDRTEALRNDLVAIGRLAGELSTSTPGETAAAPSERGTNTGS
ncbi:MAG: SRPBCC family protein [Acidimicrobiales bacterium]